MRYGGNYLINNNSFIVKTAIYGVLHRVFFCALEVTHEVTH